MIQEGEKIVRSNEDIFSAWDVDEKGCIRNKIGKPLTNIFNYIREKLESLEGSADFGYSVWDMLDYFRNNYKDDPDFLFPHDLYNLFVYYISGSNEGFYFYIEGIGRHGKKLSFFTGKTLSENREDAIIIHNALSRILEV